jgi:transcriptional regulator with XRE-family HTH domain
MKIGANIRLWREIKGLKQDDLAKRIDISPSALSNIENDISKPNIDMLESISNALEIEINQLLINPQQLFTFNNSPNSSGVYGTQHQHNYDKVLMEKMIFLLEKVTDYFIKEKK